MTQQGFEDFIYAEYDNINGTAKSYITAIRIIDEMFSQKDFFCLKGKSITCIEDGLFLEQIVDFVCTQQTLYQHGKTSFFDNVNDGQKSYPGKGFCSAAVKQLFKYHLYELDNRKADLLVSGTKRGVSISRELISFFDIDKEGTDVEVKSKSRRGQSYFRRMVFKNFNECCCVTGLNIPQTLRASHIVGWAESKVHRMNPENGLCLSATYDAAFDKHLISFDDDYRMIVGKRIRDYYTNDVVKKYFYDFEGKKITLPKSFLPSQKLLAKHREIMLG